MLMTFLESVVQAGSLYIPIESIGFGEGGGKCIVTSSTFNKMSMMHYFGREY